MKNVYYACFDDEEVLFETIEEAREQINDWKKEDEEDSNCNYRICDENKEVIEWL